MNEQKRKDATPTPKPRAAAPYKRSWKNLLINKRYQLRFTLFMVGLSTVLMVGLGIWVMRVANETTEVSATSVRGTPCPKIPTIEAPVEEPPPVPMKLPDPNAPTEDVPAEPPPDGERPRVKVQIDESSMTMMPTAARQSSPASATSAASLDAVTLAPPLRKPKTLFSG